MDRSLGGESIAHAKVSANDFAAKNQKSISCMSIFEHLGIFKSKDNSKKGKKN